MAFLKDSLTDEEVKKVGAVALKKEYNSLAETYNKIKNRSFVYCHSCDDFLASSTFYPDPRFGSGYFYKCKKCIMMEVQNQKRKTDEPNETKESVQKILQEMDLPYIDDFYDSCVKGAEDGMKEKNRKSPFATYITCVKSLPNWKGLTWKDSVFQTEEIDFDDEEDIKENSRLIKAARKRFGRDYSVNDLYYLETQYEDWVKRYPCENKAQEILYQRICFKQLDIEKAQKTGKDTKDLDKSLQEIMGTLQIKPSQSSSNALTEAKTFGQLIEKWEDEWDGGKPIPEIDPEFADVDKIGLYIDVFFKGHLAKMMGLKNGLSALYEKFISKYTVKQPKYDEDSDSEAIFDQLFGKNEEDL